MPLVEPLRDRQGALRGEAEEAIGVALQLGEVVEERRRQAADLFLDREHLGPAAAHPLGDRSGHLAVARQALALVRVAVLSGELFAAVGARPAAPGGVEVGLHLEIGLGHEVADRQLALDQERQGRGLHPADREGVARVEPQARVQARERFRPTSQSARLAAARAAAEVVELMARPQPREGLARSPPA